jgi:hypothetical protein
MHCSSVSSFFCAAQCSEVHPWWCYCSQSGPFYCNVFLTEQASSSPSSCLLPTPTCLTLTLKTNLCGPKKKNKTRRWHEKQKGTSKCFSCNECLESASCTLFHFNIVYFDAILCLMSKLLPDVKCFLHIIYLFCSFFNKICTSRQEKYIIYKYETPGNSKIRRCPIFDKQGKANLKSHRV